MNDIDNNNLSGHGPFVLHACTEVSNKLLNNLILNHSSETKIVEEIIENIPVIKVLGGNLNDPYNYNVNLFDIKISIWYILLIIIITSCIIYFIYIYMIPNNIVNFKKINKNNNKKSKSEKYDSESSESFESNNSNSEDNCSTNNSSSSKKSNELKFVDKTSVKSSLSKN